jgi:hypothetical protein
MRLRIAAVVTTAVVLVGIMGAPVLPVMIGASLAYGWLLWRSHATR